MVEDAACRRRQLPAMVLGDLVPFARQGLEGLLQPGQKRGEIFRSCFSRSLFSGVPPPRRTSSISSRILKRSSIKWGGIRFFIDSTLIPSIKRRVSIRLIGSRIFR